MTVIRFSDLIGSPRIITVQAFMLRLTPTERIGIRSAAQTYPEVQDWLIIMESGKYVDLDRQDLHKGLAAMVSFNLLAAERVTQVLSNPIQDHEFYRGVM